MLAAESLDVQIKKLCFILLYLAYKIRLIFFEHVFCAQTVVIKHVNITVTGRLGRNFANSAVGIFALAVMLNSECVYVLVISPVIGNFNFKIGVFNLVFVVLGNPRE